MTIQDRHNLPML